MAKTRAQQRDRRSPRLTAAERKQQLAATAAQWFYRHGFHGVALADVANDVGVTAPAVYRHFHNKTGLLAGAIESGLDVAEAAFNATPDEPLDDTLFSLAGAAIDRRDVWVLLQREARHLDAERRAAVQGRFDEFVAKFITRIRHARPDCDRGQLSVLATAVLAIMSSASLSRSPLPREEYQYVLAAAAAAAARAELPPPSDDEPVRRLPDQADPPSRREQLLESAIALFHEHGYAGVSLDDIGDAVGMAGPSIYHHFATKSDLLVAAFTRAARSLATQGAAGDQQALDELVRRYIQVGVGQRHLFGVYVTEAINLPVECRRAVIAELTANVEEWSAALRVRRPNVPANTRLALVYAARGIVNDIVRLGRLHTRPQIETELDILVHAVLDVNLPEQP
ncbi:TetR/AcrR family transcriptional regulator [Haloechinothrix salitolerans]|uniref:TetR/AcrR family transcriptional regulator n=1 Tax=Haloechinothrix salitolerans TaxID=926830 RepID=A0ABW2BUI4_9PSEU